MFTIKLQTEPATVRQLQIERFAPRGFLPAMLHTTAQRITQAMATLHEYGLAWTRQLEGGGKRMQTLGFVESTRLTVGDVVHVGVRVGGQRLLWRCHNRRDGGDGILRGRRNGILGNGRDGILGGRRRRYGSYCHYSFPSELCQHTAGNEILIRTFIYLYVVTTIWCIS